jgi:pantoate--beta-alanine ligase
MSLPVISSPKEMQVWANAQRELCRTIAFVPTMGALHDGHAELIRRASGTCNEVVVSIFVNPKQFNVSTDFDLYPRTMDADIATAQQAGATLIYAPEASDMYPLGFETSVIPGATAEPLEGEGRPGHFAGVTTVVAKLFNAVKPHVAFFGQKDFQQLAVIRRMVIDLDIDVEVVAVPTVREADGLALSSRNVRLSVEQRQLAPNIFRVLSTVRNEILEGRQPGEVASKGRGILESVSECRVEYLEVCDAINLQPVDDFTRPVVIAVAAWFGEVRLIDNITVSPTD